MRLGLLLGLFFCSGAAGLLYEVVWLRMLVRAFGSTTLATSNVLAVFMAGLAARAWAAGRRARTIEAKYVPQSRVRGGYPLAG